MTRIPFALFPFPNPNLSAEVIERRLRLHLAGLIAPKIGMKPPLNADDTIDEAGLNALLESMPYAKTLRLRQRATRIVERRTEKSPLSRLKTVDRKRITPLRGGVELIGIPNEHRADELAATLHAEFLWMGPATETAWHGMRRLVQRGDAGLRLPPILLDGPPGIGKGHWARRLGTLIGAPGMVYDATTENASFGLAGSQRGRGNAAPGRLVNLTLTERVANPVVVADEVEKAGIAQSDKGRSFDLTAALLPLLEPLSAGNWTCASTWAGSSGC
ncbi:AAA family ATPase [Paenirhodobacter sp.]|uniref:AAA family ATPase n=1 Tax=Paenirhodobacter sp. TaxID=1965326 RepID=UPI003B3F9F97